MNSSFDLLSSLYAVALAAATFCLGSAEADEAKRVRAGQWGATGIAMEVTESGARVEFDCAHGSIGEPLLLDSDGRFDVKGLFFREHGGPIRQGEETKGQPARYAGQVAGENMTLTVKPEESDTPIGSFNLAHGKAGRLRKCL